MLNSNFIWHITPSK